MRRIRKILTHENLHRVVERYFYLLLLVPIPFIIYPLLGPGILMFGDFPVIETSLYSDKFLATWVDYGSYYGFETLSRYPFLALGHILNTLHVGPDVISKSLLVLGFIVALFSFYFAYILFFRNKLSQEIFTYRVGAVIGSLFYAFNVWSFHRIHHWYLWIGYAFLPLFFILLIYSFKNPRNWKYPLVVVLIWSLASSTPHMVIFYGVFYVGLSIFYLIRNHRNRHSIINLGRPILLIISLYLVINLYWIYPYSLYISHSGESSLIPSILVTKEITDLFTMNSNYLNVVRLLQDWWQPQMTDVRPPETSLLYPVWLFSSFLFPLLAFTSLLLKRNVKKIMLLSIVGIVGITLTMGTNTPLSFYSILLFDAPIPSMLQYLFRDPDKWAFLIPFAFSFLIGITSFEILNKINKLKQKKVARIFFLTLIFTAFIIYVYPVYSSTSQILHPIDIPSDFNELGSHLETIDSEKIFYILQDYVPTNWSKGQDVNFLLYQQSSPKPNIGKYLLSSQNYYNYLVNSIISNKSTNINNFIYPLGTSYVIFNNDTLNTNNIKILKQLPLLQEFVSIGNVGFFNIFKAGDNKSDGVQLHIPRENIILVGGLDLFSSLNYLPSFSSKNSSLVFLDQNLNKRLKYESFNFADYLVLPKNSDDLTLSLLEEKYIVAPFDMTVHGEPTLTWSKAGTMDPLHGDFHPILKGLDIDNWDFDYGKGLAITSAIGTNLTIPIEIKNQNTYSDNKENSFYLFMRYLKNQKGGQINVYLDGNLVDKVDTVDEISNNFVWRKIDSLNLTEGSHTLTLQNIVGFNAVNIFALIPHDKMDALQKQTADLLAEKAQVIYIIEAESGLYNNKGKDTGSSRYLFNQDVDEESGNNINNNTQIRRYTGQFKVPEHGDLVSLEFLAKPNNIGKFAYSIKDLEIGPAYEEQGVFTSNFDGIEKSLNSSLKLEPVDFINQDRYLLSSSLETDRPFDGNKSLGVVVKQGNSSNWGVISTDFIPVNNYSHYEYSLNVSAEDVKQLHSKVFYYDKNKQEIDWDFVFEGRDGSFQENYKKSLSVPIGAKYLKLQFWVNPNTETPSRYLLDNLELRELSGKLDWTVYQEDILSASLETDGPFDGNKSLGVVVKQGNFSYWGVISTDFIAINEKSYYDLSFDVLGEGVNQLHSKVFYYDKNKQEIDWDFVFEGRDGSFQESYEKSLLGPIGAKYLKLQFWVSPNLETPSKYLIDNVKLSEIFPLGVSISEELAGSKNKISKTQNGIVSINGTHSINDTNTYNVNGEARGLLNLDIMKGNLTHPYKIVTKPFLLKEDHLYNFTVAIQTQNMNSLGAFATFRDSRDVSVDSVKYGNNASNGRVLSLDKGSKISTKFDIIKPSNYKIAIRAETCEKCTILGINIAGYDNDSMNNSIINTNVSTKGENHALKWLYTNSSFLKRGTYELEIYSESQSAIDSIAVFSVRDNNSKVFGGIPKGYNETGLDLFSSEIQAPAQISEYKKINPTKYILNIKNATRPFMVSFAEAYDPLWIVYPLGGDDYDKTTINGNNNFKVNSIPLYSVVNGFHINKTGNYSLVIEYQPQLWFVQGATVSIAGLVLFTIFAITLHYKKTFRVRY